MKIPLLDIKAQLERLEPKISEAVIEVIKSGQYILGEKTKVFEEAIAEFVGVKHAIGVSSGTDALLIAMMALEIKAGDIVITTPYSFFATAGVIARLNATPVFIDIEPTTYNICPKALLKYFKKNPDTISKVKAIIPVHLFGQVCEINEILKIANEYSIPIIEDAAQSLGARFTHEGIVKQAGSIGTIGCFSFFPSKNLGGIGDGGMVVTNNNSLAIKLKALRNHGAEPKYYHKFIGGNFRLDAIQAAVLSAKLPYLKTWIKERQENASYYNNLFQDTKITTPTIAEISDFHTYNQYVISVPNEREELRKFLNEKNIGNEVYYPCPFHLQECFKYLNYSKGDFPHSEYAAKHCLAIPIYPEITQAMQDYVAQSIKGFYK